MAKQHPEADRRNYITQPCTSGETSNFRRISGRRLTSRASQNTSAFRANRFAGTGNVILASCQPLLVEKPGKKGRGWYPEPVWFQLQETSYWHAQEVLLALLSTRTEPDLSLTVRTPRKPSGTSSMSAMYLMVSVLPAGNHLYVDSPNRSPFVSVARLGMGNGIVLNSKPRQNSRPFHGT